MRMAEKSLLLQLLDQTWKDHLLSLDHLRQGINLRAYAQRDPLNEYKREAFELFEAMLANLRQQVTSVLSHVELRVHAAQPDRYLCAIFRRRARGGDARGASWHDRRRTPGAGNPRPARAAGRSAAATAMPREPGAAAPARPGPAPRATPPAPAAPARNSSTATAGSDAAINLRRRLFDGAAGLILAKVAHVASRTVAAVIVLAHRVAGVAQQARSCVR